MKKIKIRKSPVESGSKSQNDGDQKNYALVWNDRHKYYDSKPDSKQGVNKTLKAVPKAEANIEAEAGETIIGDFDSDNELEHMTVGGKKHYNGGTPLNVPEGAFVFSDTPKLKIGGEVLSEFGKSIKTKSKYTPAALAKQYDLNKYKELLSDEKSDVYDKTTARIMTDNNQQKLGKLAFFQEAMKGFPQGIPPVAEQMLNSGEEENQSMQAGGRFVPRGKKTPFTDEYGNSSIGTPNKDRYFDLYRRANSGDILTRGEKNEMNSLGTQLGMKFINNIPTAEIPYNAPQRNATGRPNIISPFSDADNANIPFNGNSATGSSSQSTPQRTVKGTTSRNYVPWVGDKYGVHAKGTPDSNASKYSADEIDQKARALGYTGPRDNTSLQQWIVDQGGESAEAVENLHEQHGMPNAGKKVDGKWGYRWDTALTNMKALKPYTNTDHHVAYDGKIAPPAGVPGVNTSTPVDPSLTPGDPNFITAKPNGITPNMWDMFGTLHAATRPIDHLRPNLYRTDPANVNPSLVDNRAEIQQIQGSGQSINNAIQNTSSGQVGRANMIGAQGRLFDAINNSNANRDRQNVGIVNDFARYNNEVNNRADVTNIGALNQFADQTTKYRENLSKEKQLKFEDFMGQGENMTNNMARMMTIQNENPNYTVSPFSWLPTNTFVPGQGNPFTSSRSTGRSSGSIIADFQALKAQYPNEDPKYLWESLTKSAGYTQQDRSGDVSSPVTKTRTRVPR